MAPCRNTPEPEINAVLSDPSVRYFCKAILNGSLKYDPVDALADVELAAKTLLLRWERIARESRQYQEAIWRSEDGPQPPGSYA